MTFRALKLRILAALFAGLLMACGVARAQSALLISDIHFDPFHDPAKTSLLAAAPVSGWDAILASADSPTQAKDFAALQKTCKATAPGVDTNYALLASTLRALKESAAEARFITMSGDMLAHQFTCRFATTMPTATPAQFDVFVEKTMQYEAEKLEQTLPHVPLYLTLGNDDSNCDDYELNTNTAFLQAVGKTVGHGVGAAWGAAAAKSFATGGYYSVTMAAPMQRTRLIVVNDIFLSTSYKSCAEKADEAPGKVEMQWLQQQMDAARRMHQRVWVVGHIPPGVNPFATMKKGPLKICAPAGTKDAGPAMFMSSDVLGDTLVKNADVMRLAIFGHTHTDEMRLLGAGETEVAAKIVPSITPVYGNKPAFTVAQVDPATATMVDYTVFATTDVLGTSWAKEYNFSEAYGRKGFTPAALGAIVDGFRADTTVEAPSSLAYLRFYAAGEPMVPPSPLIWQAGVCALTGVRAAEFSSCVCGLLH